MLSRRQAELPLRQTFPCLGQNGTDFLFQFLSGGQVSPVERQLAHGERDDVRAAYNYAEYLPERRKMMQEWADYLSELKEKASL